jgi:hypothetical protein
VAVYCGIDWAEGHHDIALVDGDGRLIAKRRISETPDGIAELTAMLGAAGDSQAQPIPVAIETPRGLLIAVLRATGRPIYPSQADAADGSAAVAPSPAANAATGTGANAPSPPPPARPAALV